MTMSSIAKTGLVQLWQVPMIAIRYALAKPTGRQRNQVEEAYLLRPRCCRSQHYF